MTLTAPASPAATAIVDAHVHLNDRDASTATAAVNDLERQMEAAGVAHAVVLHLRSQRWSLEEVAAALQGRAALTGFANLDPFSATVDQDLRRAIELGFKGLKLHPRQQSFRPDDPACIALVRRAGEIGWPTLIDAFPDGDWLLAGLDVLQYARLAKAAPLSRVIVAHAAGHHCLDLLMLAKRVPNLWFDVSYSLLYYGSPVVDALFYALRSIRYERVLFGTDYPDRPLPASVTRSLELLDHFGVTGEARNRLLCHNARQLLQLPSA